MKIKSRLAVGTILANLAFGASADDSNFKLSGFASIVGGSVLSGDKSPPLSVMGYSSPLFIADWHNAGFYEKSFSLKPETRAGVQGTYQFTQNFRATAQVTTRAVDADPRLEWAYLSYRFGNWEVQVGRKRIPLYYYSDFQDIGVAYPWVTPPTELYGWEASNYNGARLRYRGSMGSTSYTASVFTGSETVKNARYFRITDQASYEPTDAKWTNLVGADLEINRDWLTVRGVYVQNDIENHFKLSDFFSRQKMVAYGVAVNADFDDWFALSEFGINKRSSPDLSANGFHAKQANIGIGYRIGNWTPFVSMGLYSEVNPVAATGVTYTDADTIKWRSYSATLRYDFNPSNAVKVQLNRHVDTNHNFTGDATLLRISYDMVF